MYNYLASSCFAIGAQRDKVLHDLLNSLKVLVYAIVGACAHKSQSTNICVKDRRHICSLLYSKKRVFLTAQHSVWTTYLSQ